MPPCPPPVVNKLPWRHVPTLTQWKTEAPFGVEHTTSLSRAHHGCHYTTLMTSIMNAECISYILLYASTCKCFFLIGVFSSQIWLHVSRSFDFYAVNVYIFHNIVNIVTDIKKCYHNGGIWTWFEFLLKIWRKYFLRSNWEAQWIQQLFCLLTLECLNTSFDGNVQSS